jgi:uncharacterized membrane protein YphA (DoxX/SURF4 family)
MRRVPQALSLLLRLAVGGVLIWAAVVKLRQPSSFAQDIANYRLVPPSWVPLFAASLPGIELVLGSALAMGLWTRAAALATTTLLLVFTAAIGSALVRNINIDCGCFGASGQPATWWTFLRDVALVGAAGFVAWRERG